MTTQNLGDGAPRTLGETLFSLDQPVRIGDRALYCTVADGTGLPFSISIDGGAHTSRGRTPDAALLGLEPLSLRQGVRVHLSALATSAS